MTVPEEIKATPPWSYRGQRWALVGFVFGVVAIVMAVRVVMEQHPRLSADEKLLVGRWYSYAELKGDNVCLIAIEAYAPDHTMSVVGRTYLGREEDGKIVWIADDEIKPEEMPVRWSLGSGVCQWESDGSSPYTFLERVRIFLRARHWPGKGNVIEAPAVVRLTPEEKEFEIRSIRLTILSVRVSDDFVLPDEPLTPQKALESWAARQPGSSPVQKGMNDEP